jgi:endothelin-converting enzyme/putative endopeptidase
MNTLRSTSLSSLLGLLLLASCGNDALPPPKPPTPPPPTTSAATASVTPPTGPVRPSVDESALDRSANACDDFYQYACGNWLKETKIPDDEASWGRSFSVIRDRNEQTLRDILEKLAKEGGSDPVSRPLGDFYAACMDEAGIEKAGLGPLQPVLKTIDEIKDASTLTKAFAKLDAQGIFAPFAFGQQQDFEDANKVIAVVEQAGLGMPEREYYLKEDARMKDLRAKYEEHVKNMFVLLGEKSDVAAKSAATVMKVERALADASMKKEDLREPKKIYHRTQRADLSKLAPAIKWDAYLAEVGQKDLPLLNVAQPDFVKAVDKMVSGDVKPAEWKTYLRWHVVHKAAPALPAKFVDENFKWRQALTGIAKIPPRWKRCVRAADHAIGEMLAQPFVQKTLGSEGKAKVKAMIEAIEAVMKENLDGLAWMDAETRAQAHRKLAKIANKVAYPDKWRSYEGLVVDRSSYAANVMRADAWEMKRQLAKIGKPVDRSEWLMTPPSVNAYYEPSLNEMVFPAGILQPPFYANDVSMPINFGGIGMVMGHELTHGFDDEGRQFDADGNLKDWWTAKVNAEFDKRATCVEKQFDEYTVLGDLHVNGKLTLGENIADLGGVKLAFAAMKKQLAKEPSPGSFTPEQQFFLGFAQGWCTNMRDEALRMLVNTNPHAPPKLRVNGPLSNIPEFAQAFQCKPGSKMTRGEKRCEVW